MQIQYTSHATKAFLYKGILRNFFLIRKEPIRKIVWIIAAINALIPMIPLYPDYVEIFHETETKTFFFIAMVVGYLKNLAVSSVIMIVIYCVFGVLWPYFTVHKRHKPTDVHIDVGNSITTEDTITRNIPWSTIREYGIYKDMVVINSYETKSSYIQIILDRSCMSDKEHKAVLSMLEKTVAV